MFFPESGFHLSFALLLLSIPLLNGVFLDHTMCRSPTDELEINIEPLTSWISSRIMYAGLESELHSFFIWGFSFHFGSVSLLLPFAQTIIRLQLSDMNGESPTDEFAIRSMYQRLGNFSNKNCAPTFETLSTVELCSFSFGDSVSASIWSHFYRQSASQAPNLTSPERGEVLPVSGVHHSKCFPQKFQIRGTPFSGDLVFISVSFHFYRSFAWQYSLWYFTIRRSRLKNPNFISNPIFFSPLASFSNLPSTVDRASLSSFHQARTIPGATGCRAAGAFR